MESHRIHRIIRIIGTNAAKAKKINNNNYFFSDKGKKESNLAKATAKAKAKKRKRVVNGYFLEQISSLPPHRPSGEDLLKPEVVEVRLGQGGKKAAEIKSPQSPLPCQEGCGT
jgi:hypothetical protein